jgi:indole-3-glycerol phosphate synthase
MKRDTRRNLLDLILRERRRDARLAEWKQTVSELEALARNRRHRSLAERLRAAKRPCIIAEMKKASPSAGILCTDYHPEEIARTYAAAGAAAVSVLTEPHRFLGDIEHLRQVRKAVDLPILRKDFIGDPYQIYESAAGGADVILLIAKALDPALMRDLYQLALSLGLEILIEANSTSELEEAASHSHAILGVNNRNLQTLETDLTIGLNLAGHLPEERPAVIESGIKERPEVERFWELGYKGFLIGEALMRSPEPDRLLGELAGEDPE